MLCTADLYICNVCFVMHTARTQYFEAYRKDPKTRGKPFVRAAKALVPLWLVALIATTALVSHDVMELIQAKLAK